MKRCIDYGLWTPEHGTLLLYTVYIEHYWSTPFLFFFHNFKKYPGDLFWMEDSPPPNLVSWCFIIIIEWKFPLKKTKYPGEGPVWEIGTNNAIEDSRPTPCEEGYVIDRTLLFESMADVARTSWTSITVCRLICVWGILFNSFLGCVGESLHTFG